MGAKKIITQRKYVPDRIENAEQKQKRLEDYKANESVELLDLYSDKAPTEDGLEDFLDCPELCLHKEPKMSIRLEDDCLVIDYKLLKEEYKKLKKKQNRVEMARFIISVKNRIKSIKD